MNPYESGDCWKKVSEKEHASMFQALNDVTEYQHEGYSPRLNCEHDYKWKRTDG